jgi:hypothetical protein
MSNRTGYLTILSADRTEIYGEFADAEWKSEMTTGGKNNVFSGIASEGTLETFLKLDSDAISHVAYNFESDGQTYTGNAELLAPVIRDLPDLPQIRIETGEIPTAA